MKPTLHLLILAAASSGIAFGQTVTAYTPPVGYETLAVPAGVNFLGMRLLPPVLAAGTITAKDATSVTCGTLDVAALLDDNTVYILEIENANGVTQDFLGSAAVGSVITTTPADLSAKVAVNDTFKIRAAQTLASVFGLNNTAGLKGEAYGFGGDIVLLPNPATEGSFDQYYYDTGWSSWADVNGAPVDGSKIAWNYADSVLIITTGEGATELTVTGEVKLGNTGYNLLGGANAVNFLSSVSPAQATLASAFGLHNSAGLTGEAYGFGGDIVMVSNLATEGFFDQYYYDTGWDSWADVNGVPVADATQIDLTSGIIIINAGDAKDVVNTPPASYGNL